ncbi:Glucose and ribitol dehydrogenase [Trametes pubescens]|uniref:Glucose and ribitol dehydrogenase n=1 Tax=Trametes pubescens TaxID=154538 RepID=A0A1M2W7I9_TRAPU|nr:Glucose and ribitol dehydrogenase [Trametes pubescens]
MLANVPEQYKKGWKPPFQEQSATPGKQFKLDPAPLDDVTADGKPYKAAGKLEGRKALITGADSGIGRSVALLFALEGADLTLTFLPGEKQDAQDMLDVIKKKTNNARKINVVELDLRKEESCIELVKNHLGFHGSLDAIILNHGTQQANIDLASLPTEQWHDTFNTNIHSFFYICKAAIPHLEEGSTITFNASINMAVGHPELIDYTATKGAMIGFMRALSNQIVGEKGVRCNAVAPGPIWTPLIPATMTKEAIDTFGTTVPIGRAGQPVEVATAFVWLTSADSSYVSGQIIHVNGGVVIE